MAGKVNTVGDLLNELNFLDADTPIVCDAGGPLFVGLRVDLKQGNKLVIYAAPSIQTKIQDVQTIHEQQFDDLTNSVIPNRTLVEKEYDVFFSAIPSVGHFAIYKKGATIYEVMSVDKSGYGKCMLRPVINLRNKNQVYAPETRYDAFVTSLYRVEKK